jgi:uncharacterized membrane protein
MADDAKTDTKNPPSWLGGTLTILSGISFFLLCIAFPLVGPAGSRVPNATKNKAVFFAVLILTLLLSGFATRIKLQQRKTLSQLPFPTATALLSGTCIAILIILLFNGFSI